MDEKHPQVRRLLALFPGSTTTPIPSGETETKDEELVDTIVNEPVEPTAPVEESVVVEGGTFEATAETPPPPPPVEEGDSVTVEGGTFDTPAEEPEEAEEEEEVEEVEEEKVAEEAPFKTFAEKVQELVDGNDRDALKKMADDLGVTYGSRSNKTEIATEIVEAQQAE
jgi:hypothetical protein